MTKKELVTVIIVNFNGGDLLTLPEQQMQRLRGTRIAMIFQDPMMTLNPVLRIDTQMIETVRAHEKVSRKEAWRHRVAVDAKSGPGLAHRTCQLRNAALGRTVGQAIGKGRTARIQQDLQAAN